ncbi:MAG: hypothetical protein EBU75_03245 [Betaproteobacteria bacterium]|nr:hypothetical protein [Betaproteobacteria bacterium]NDD12625.1 hypothetical protein [Betaproteobacteria bacterium]
MTTTEPVERQGDPLSLLFDFSEAIAHQREALAKRDWLKLQNSIRTLQQAMHQIASFPGGAEGLRHQLLASDGQERQTADRLIEKVMVERRSSAELIRLQLQRFQALQAMTSLGEDAATYTETGGGQGRGSRLSTWV